MNNFSKNLSNYKLITFDLNDTLLKFRHSPAIQYAKTAARHGYNNIDQSKMTTNFHRQYKEMTSKYPNFGSSSNLDWKEWWRRLVIESLSMTEPTINEKDLNMIAIQLIDQYTTSECWIKLPGTDELLQKLKEENKVIGIISNTDPRIKTIVSNMELPKFNFILNSYEAGHQKPSKEIFEVALKNCYESNSTEPKPNEALHIGNTPLIDYVGAKKAGWSSILITNGQEDWKLHTEINESHVFNNLEEFVQSLENKLFSF